MDPIDTSTDDAPTTPTTGLDPGDIEARLMVADRLAEFRATVLASLGMDVADLPTLRSVLDGQLVCEREAAETIPRRAPIPLTVRQSMDHALKTGASVKLGLRWHGEAIEHVCQVTGYGSPGLARGSGLGWSIWPMVDARGGPFRWVVSLDSDPVVPFVVSCEPVPKGLAIVPESEGS